jgi:hypothetical protein
MTNPRPETLEREKDKLYLTDAGAGKQVRIPAETAFIRRKALLAGGQSMAGQAQRASYGRCVHATPPMRS